MHFKVSNAKKALRAELEGKRVVKEQSEDHGDVTPSPCDVETSPSEIPFSARERANGAKEDTALAEGMAVQLEKKKVELDTLFKLKEARVKELDDQLKEVSKEKDAAIQD
ncbi:hypothetical protein R1sor_010789 [Riccia sorocarpa]|uniref:Uncharacterized protein n=1 Tax=Riccia sorocarpa TaxID=122646 RepID=A0ABD3HZD4_9MARC